MRYVELLVNKGRVFQKNTSGMGVGDWVDLACSHVVGMVEGEFGLDRQTAWDIVWYLGVPSILNQMAAEQMKVGSLDRDSARRRAEEVFHSMTRRGDPEEWGARIDPKEGLVSALVHLGWKGKRNPFVAAGGPKGELRTSLVGKHVMGLLEPLLDLDWAREKFRDVMEKIGGAVNRIGAVNVMGAIIKSQIMRNPIARKVVDAYIKEAEREKPD